MVVGGGRALSLGGCFFQPSVLVGANTDMQLAHEETFGPVAPIIRWESYIYIENHHSLSQRSS